MTSPVSAWRAAWLLTRLQLRRQRNQIRALNRFRKAQPARAATRRKASAGGVLTAVVVLCMLFNFVNMSVQGMANIDKTLGSTHEQVEVRRSWIGVQTGQVTAEVAGRLGIPAHGALITAVSDGGPAKSAGLQSGDVIVEFDRKVIKDNPDLPRVVAVTPTGKTAQVVVVRNGKEERRNVMVSRLVQPTVRPMAPAPGSVLPLGVMKGATFAATLLLLAALFTSLASRDMTRGEWDLEWLVTLPLPMPTLLLGRITERALTNTAGLMFLGPFLSVVAWECGDRWTAPLLGLGLTFVLLFAVAAAQTLVDTGLRLSLSPPKLRNLQAIISIVSVLLVLLPMSMCLHDDGFAFGWAAALPDWTRWLPTGLAVRALSTADGGTAALWSVAMAGEIVLTVAIAYALLQRQLRHGVVAAGTREAVARVPRAAAGRPTAPAPRRVLLPAVQRRELRLLGRDRTFLAQTLLLPVIIVGAQVLMTARTNVFVGAVEHPAVLAAIAFGLAAYTLMASAFQTLNAEGQALWILYCVPRSLESVLWQKTKLWAAAVTIYPVLIFAIAIAVAGTISLQFIGSAAIVLLGVPIFAVIATTLGVFGSDPLAQDIHRRVRLSYVYLYMTLASLYVYAIYASTVWQRAAMVTLTALLAIALWQKARDQLDYLLDPTALPPARVSVSDGMIAALTFFVLQAVVAILFKVFRSDAAAATVLWVAFCVAGAVTYAVMRLAYWRARTAGVPRVLGDGLPRALLWGVAGGIVAAVAGVTYVGIVTSMDLFPPAQHTSLAADRTTAMTLAAIAFAAAPIFEEFIFRGLIFGGLRRSLGLGAATLASAAIFAIIHPPMAVIPVFVMGVCAALIYERTRMLAAPMLVHAIYNAAVIGFHIYVV